MEIDVKAIEEVIKKETDALQGIEAAVKAAQGKITQANTEIQNLMALRIETISRIRTMQLVIGGDFTEKKPARKPIRKPTKGK